MDHITPEQAGIALGAAERARHQVADEVGLPRGYWWAMAGGWVLLGSLGSLAPSWVAGAATAAFGVGHAVLASRLLDGRRRTGQVQVSRTVAGRRVPLVVIGMLVALVALTILAALALDADGAEHASIWAAALVAAVIGFGGPEMLRVLRRWVRA
jgi:MFS family permease